MSKQDLGLVPGRGHYASSYVQGGRLFSYANQMNAVLGYKPAKVVEVGPGPGMVTASLRLIGINVLTVDIQPDLKPDIIASVTQLPFDDDAFDVSMCCQVLEHLPQDQFLPALKELTRVSRTAVVLSLPDCTIGYYVHLNLPKLSHVRLAFHRRRKHRDSYRKRQLERDGHYWEIGYPGVTAKTIQANLAEAGLGSVTSWRVSEMPYHRFFSASKMGAIPPASTK